MVHVYQAALKPVAGLPKHIVFTYHRHHYQNIFRTSVYLSPTWAHWHTLAPSIHFFVRLLALTSIPSPLILPTLYQQHSFIRRCLFPYLHRRLSVVVDHFFGLMPSLRIFSLFFSRNNYTAAPQ